MLKFKLNEINRIEYTNWKGTTRKRSIIPLELEYGKTKFHPEEQWLVKAVDCEDRQIKFFALKDMIPCTD